MENQSEQIWRVCDRFLDIRSQWFTLIGEHLQDHQGKILEYWRIEKADSVIILPILANQLILPPPTYRPGLGEATFDFPGGRVSQGQNPDAAVIAILVRELEVKAEEIVQVAPLNTRGWAVNSSFSNQKLYGFVAHLQPSVTISTEYIGATYPASAEGIRDLLEVLWKFSTVYNVVLFCWSGG
jgi:hypothetical protein